MPDKNKACSKCGEVKPLEDFYLEKGKPRGACKPCHRAKAYEKRGTDEARARERAYRKANRDKRAPQTRAWRAKNKERLNAERRAARAENPEPIRAVQKAWRDANRDRALETQRESYERRKDEVQAKVRADRKANPEKYREWERTKRERHAEAIKERQRIYYENNPGVYERHRAARRARLANVEHQPYTRREIYERDGGACRGCSKALPNEKGAFQIDHIVPISLGGPDTPANVQLMCPKCNRAKWATLEGQIHMPV